MPTNEKDLHRLASMLDPYDRRATVAEFAAQMTLPQNAGFNLRLRLLVQVAASLPERDGLPPPTAHRLKSIANSDLVAGLCFAEDPAEFPVVEPLVYQGRAYSVMGGQLEDHVFRVEHLLMALGGAATAVDAGLARRWASLAAAALALSEATVRRSGLALGAGPKVAQAVRVELGIEDRVTWTHADLSSMLAAGGLPPDSLDALVMSAGSSDLSLERDSATTVSSPIVRFADGDVVVVPLDLLTGLAHHLLGEAARAGILDLLSKGFCAAVAAGIGWTLDRLTALDGVDVPKLPSQTEHVLPLAFRGDGSALVVVVLASEPLGFFDPGAVISEAEHDAAFAACLEGVLAEAVAWASGERGADEPVLVVGSLSLAPNRNGTHPLRVPVEDWLEFLPLTPGSLIAMAIAERGDPLGLVKFAFSRRELHERTHVMAWNALDEYGLYYDHGRSFYVSDDRLPTLVSVASDYGLAPRLAAIRELQTTSAVFPGIGHVVVYARYPDEHAPIYVAPGSLPGHALLVRAPGLDMWVVTKRRTDLGPVEFVRTHDLIDAVAYWLWQAAPRVLAMVPHETPRTIVFQVEVPDADEWAPEDEPDIDAAGAVPDRDNDVVHVWIERGFAAAAAAADNRAERWLVALLARAIVMLHGRDLTGPDARAIVDAVAPHPQQKMLIVLTPDATEEIGADDGLWHWRQVDDWTASRVLDDLATALAADGHVPGPAGNKAAQVRLINRAVDILYRRLVDEVADLSPGGLVEVLLEHSEALLREAALRRVQTPTRVACFGAHSDMATRLAVETRNLSTASIATRFILEYVAARPPSGTKALDDWRLDRLVAIAATIVDFGFQSDVTMNELADTNARILPNGRVGTRREGFGDAVSSYVSALMPSQVRVAQEAFERRWERADIASLPPAVDDAFLAEFGYTLTNVASIVSNINLLTAPGGAVAALPRSEVIARVTGGTNVGAPVVEMVLDDLTLAPRPDFLTPLVGFATSDIYPWLFNRRLSFVRRPIVARGSGIDPELVWGWRSVVVAVRQVIGLIHEGRLGASSDAMRAYIDRQTSTASDKFVDAVASIAAGAGLSVSKNVWAFGPVRMERSPGQTLGDVDVLAIDQTRRILWAIECKNLVFAKTPHELASEILDLQKPDKGMIAKHQKRIDWINANMSAVSAELGLPAGRWRVRGVLTVHTDLMSLHLRPMAMTVVPAEALADLLARG